MITDDTNQLHQFHAFVGEQLKNGGANLTPEQALALWRERVEMIDAVGEGLRAVAEGRSKSLDQFKSDFESRHNISSE